MKRLRRSWIHWRRVPAEGLDAAQVLVGGGLAHLNPVAAWIWEEIERAPDRAVLFRRLRRRCAGVDDRTLRRDLDHLLEDWLRLGWIEWQEDPVFSFPEETWPA
jgi:hypothetical protein